MKTINGQWLEAPNGTLVLQLERQERIGGGPHPAPRCYAFTLGPAGQLEDERIWGNDELMNEGSKYRMTIFDAIGSILFGPLHFSLCGPSPLNLNRMIQSRMAPSFATYGISSDNVFGQPQPGQEILVYTFAFPTVFPANFQNPNSYFTVDDFPLANAVFNVFGPPAGSLLGTITMTPLGVVTFSTAGFTMQPGDRMAVIAPDPMDARLNSPALTLVGTRLA